MSGFTFVLDWPVGDGVRRPLRFYSLCRPPAHFSTPHERVEQMPENVVAAFNGDRNEAFKGGSAPWPSYKPVHTVGVGLETEEVVVVNHPVA